MNYIITNPHATRVERLFGKRCEAEAVRQRALAAIECELIRTWMYDAPTASAVATTLYTALTGAALKIVEM